MLVGRQQELSKLWRLFEETLEGRLQVVLVEGEPGIGKTRLLREIAQHTEESGALVLHGGASEAEGMPPYLPFLEALGSYIRTAPREQLLSQAGPLAPILATILPELTLALGELPHSYPLPAEQARPLHSSYSSMIFSGQIPPHWICSLTLLDNTLPAESCL